MHDLGAVAPVLASVRGFPAPVGPLDLDLRAGEVVLVRGGNGSGKTSLLRAVAGLDAPLAPSSAHLDGHDPRGLTAKRLAPLVSAALQDPFDTLAGLTVAGEARLRGLDLPLGLRDLAERDVATLSSGEGRRVALTLASQRAPSVLLLDEPAEGLDAHGRETLSSLVRAQATRGAVLAADHTGLLASLATRIIDLAPAPSAAAGTIPSAGGPVLVAAPAQSLPRGDRSVKAPAVALPAGFHAIVGPNASGKSTLLLALAGLLPASVAVDGKPPRPGQDTQLLLPRVADLFTHDTVAAELAGVEAGLVQSFVDPRLLPRHPLSLSAGEGQRVGLAKVLGRPSRLVLLDEPEAHLDAAGRKALVAAIARRVAQGACVVAATHDAPLQALAHSTLLLEVGAP